ncbi:M56 family metallopeptidase [Blastococcus litoris]|uniref:M56 family metallopeptidase n=1 Tax=Blastococcus litoris TaxID=2171622 RepID=UPI0013DF8F22|nr:M56 family metallopeptidase [Blastococcus litoris]
MTPLVALSVGGILLAWRGHRLLSWLAGRRVDPTILLTGWTASTVGLVASLLATLSLVALPVGDHHSGALRLAGECWTAISSGVAPGAAATMGGIGVMTAAVVVVRIAYVVHGRFRRRRRNAPHLRQLRALAADCRGQEPLWIEDERPIALSIGGRAGLIILSRALQTHLTPAAVRATLEHERAHLRGRHHLILAVVDTLATALPWCPLLRAAPEAARDLVELAADSQAARRCGKPAVREALSRLTGHPMPAAALAMAGRLTEARLQRLSSGSLGASGLSRLAGCSAIAAGALVLPAATAGLAARIVLCAFG